MYGEVMPEDLYLSFGTWEDAGRAFNAAIPAARTRDMFQDRSVTVVQNIMLVVVYARFMPCSGLQAEVPIIRYERAVGSNLAIHLANEAVRFALAYHYHQEDSAITSVEAITRKCIFFTLFQWST